MLSRANWWTLISAAVSTSYERDAVIYTHFSGRITNPHPFQQHERTRAQVKAAPAAHPTKYFGAQTSIEVNEVPIIREESERKRRDSILRGGERLSTHLLMHLTFDPSLSSPLSHPMIKVWPPESNPHIA